MEVLETLARHWEAGTPVALATVVSTAGSAPRAPGASLVVTPTGEVTGSVSGGCVEGAVVDAATQVLHDGVPRLLRYGFSDADAFAIGLTCGGIIEIFVQRVDPASAPWVGDLAAAVREGRETAVATVIEHPDDTAVGTTLLLPGEGSHQSGVRHECDGVRVFVLSCAAPPRLIIFGAIDFAAALAEVGAFLGHRVTVCDARPVFATPARFPGATEVVVDWPHRYLRAEAEAGRIDGRTAVCVLTHDAKFDVPALEVALRLPVGYVGAMGSRRTHTDRLARLVAAGLSPDELARLHSPIGLDIGARTPQETALSIAAEIVSTRSGASGTALRRRTGPIHAGGSVAESALHGNATPQLVAQVRGTPVAPAINI